MTTNTLDEDDRITLLEAAESILHLMRLAYPNASSEYLQECAFNASELMRISRTNSD